MCKIGMIHMPQWPQHRLIELLLSLTLCRSLMSALVQLNPTLPQDMDKRHGVTVNGFHEASTTIKFDGTSSAVESARNEIDSLISEAKETTLTLAFPHSLLSLAKKQLVQDNCQTYVGPEAIVDSSVTVKVYSFKEQDHKRAVSLLQSIPTKKEVIVPSAVMKKLSDSEIQMKKVEEKFCTEIELQSMPDAQDGKVVITGFQCEGVKEAQKEIFSLVKRHSETRVTFDCKPEEVVYLLGVTSKETRSLFSSLPAKVTTRGDQIELYGNLDSVEKSKDKLRNGPLLGLHYKKFPFKCNSKFLSQIQTCVLKPLVEEQKLDFQVWIVKSNFQSSSSKGEREPTAEQSHGFSEFEIIIYSKDKSAFDKVCEAMDVIDPQTQQFQLAYRGVDAANCARRLKETLEGKFQLRIIVPDGNNRIIIHGLVPEKIQQCWEEINNEIGCTIETVKHINVKRHEWKYLECKCSNDLKKEFRCDIGFPYLKKTETHSVRIAGKIRDVEAAESKISKILEAGILVITFSITCSRRSHPMWRKWWFDFRKHEEETNDIMIYFNDTAMRQTRDGSHIIEVTFEVIGTNADRLRCIRDTVSNERTEKRIVEVSDDGKVALRNAVSQQRLPILDRLAIAIDIDSSANKITLVSPKSLADDLATAETEIQKFVGMYANTSKELVSHDSVVGLILTSSPKSATYRKSAEYIAKLHNVKVKVLGAPVLGLKLTGSPLAIQKAEPQIRATVFKEIEKILDQAQLQIPSAQSALLTSSEFSQIETKLQNDFCVILSYQRPGVSSKAVYTTVLKRSPTAPSLQLDICQGDIVHEKVDVIVNAANEELQHIGGLAKSIVDCGGVAIQSESSQYVRSSGRVATGSCVCLGAGKLSCKRIIHAVGPQWHGGGRNEEKTLHDTVYKCLQCSDKENLTSIALPAISAGVFGVPEVVCARASLTAVRDYCQSNPNSNIITVRFVLYTKSALEHFGSALKSMTPVEDCKPLFASEIMQPEIGITWSWENDVKSYSPYHPDVSDKLTKEYENDPTSSTVCFINGQRYTVDFSKMVQINCLTGFQRKIRRTTKSPAKSPTIKPIHWEYKDDHHSWAQYKARESQVIEEMYRDDTPGELTIVGNVYTFDFSSMYQINTRTNYKRQIRRVNDTTLSSSHVISRKSTSENECTSESKVMHNSSDESKLTITLRGPRDALQQAKAELEEKLKGMYVSHTVPFPPALEKKLNEIVTEHNVIWHFEKGSAGGKRKKKQRKMCKLRIEGLSSEVSFAVMAIHEEIITHQIESASDGEIEYPEEWEEMESDTTTKVFPLEEGTEEWNYVAQRFSKTMQTSRISQITRIQNKWLWEKYVFQRKRLDIKNNGNINELELFHGTRGNDPKLIYENEVGFDMRYSSQGMWGQANYFAKNASYSHSYAHSTSDGSREMFFVKVLAGDSCECSSDSSLRKPPFKSTGATEGGLQFAQVQYDTVTGYTNGSEVYMTYDNEKAYPTYLIKYRGNRWHY